MCLIGSPEDYMWTRKELVRFKKCQQEFFKWINKEQKKKKSDRVKRSKREYPISGRQLHEVHHLSHGEPGEKQKGEKKYLT